MTSTTLDLDEDVAAGQRRAAVRLLLRSPLVRPDAPDPEVFAYVVRHRQAVGRWFADTLNWRLYVDPHRRFARLHKRPSAGSDPSRGVVIRERPFNRRRYTLFALACAELDGPDPQTILSRLADGVTQRSAVEEGIPTYDPTRRSERMAFVDVVALLEELGVLRLREGTTTTYLDSPTLDENSDPFFDVDRSILSSLASPPTAPSRADGSAGIAHEEYPATEAGERARSRHQLYRRLVDDPVAYDEDLTDGERTHLVTQGAARIEAELATWTGMSIERRAEGIAAIDGDEELTDNPFPGDGVRPHAALLLAEDFAARLRAASDRSASVLVEPAEVERLVAGYIDVHRNHWPTGVIGQTGAAATLAGDALVLLAGYGLVRKVGDRWRIMPAIARLRPQAFVPRPDQLGLDLLGEAGS